jgi:hypothetical protein
VSGGNPEWVWPVGKKLPKLVRRRQVEGVAYASVLTAGMEMGRDIL